MKDKTKYHIPRKYKKPEIPEFKKDRARIYEEMDYEIDMKVGITLEQLYAYNEEEYFTCIHRTIHDKDSIFKKGISYGNDDTPEFGNHVQIFQNFPTMLSEIKNCNNYKGSTGCFIIKVPKKDVNRKFANDSSEPIYYKNKDGYTYLRPEFIAAYVPVFEKELKDVELNKYSHNDIYEEDTTFYFDQNLLNVDDIKQNY